jgi:RNA polymerase sigma-70 factor, ECF subfamily
VILYDGSCVSAPWRRTALSEGEQTQKNELPEAEAIRRAQQGDAAGFELLYQLHCRRVYAICLRLVRNSSEAEDLTQEAFLLVFRKIGTFRGASAFSTWLHRLTLNVALVHLRKKNPDSASLHDETRQVQETHGPRKEAGNPDPSLTGLVDRVNLERAVAQLTWSCRTVFVLHDIQGFMHREIAQIMNCSVGTSKVRLHRAHTQLRELLRENPAPFPMTSQSSCESGPCSSPY